ncbi:hypothetical protein CR513_59696, partial [Mucuna pruriens]
MERASSLLEMVIIQQPQQQQQQTWKTHQNTRLKKTFSAIVIFGINLVAANIGSDIKSIILLCAMGCYFIASVGESSFTTTIIFNVSGIFAFETLLCIILPYHLWWCFYVINLLFLVVASLCFKDKIIHLLKDKIIHLLRRIRIRSISNAASFEVGRLPDTNGAVIPYNEKKNLEELKLKNLKVKNYLFQVIDRTVLETILKNGTSREI